MAYEQLVVLLEKLSSEFHQILEISQIGNKPDGIIFSISVTLDNALSCVSSHKPLSFGIVRGIEKANVVAVKSFEGTGLDDALFKIEVLLKEYQKSFLTK